MLEKRLSTTKKTKNGPGGGISWSGEGDHVLDFLGDETVGDGQDEARFVHPRDLRTSRKVLGGGRGGPRSIAAREGEKNHTPDIKGAWGARRW